MNQEIKTRWLKALRDGSYKQGHGRLRLEEEFCCLGVLCDLYIKDTNSQWQVSSEWEFGARLYEFRNEITLPPREVLDWAGIKGNCAVNTQHGTLSSLNDCGLSFNRIAEIIEKDL